MTKKSIINIKVSGVKKLNNSSNGNPKYEFHFHKGGIATTPSDAGWCMLLALILFGVSG